MRAFYATQDHIRVFILGFPEGWCVGVFDLQRKQWTQMNGFVFDTLKAAKTAAEEHAVSLTGKMSRRIKWH